MIAQEYGSELNAVCFAFRQARETRVLLSQLPVQLESEIRAHLEGQ